MKKIIYLHASLLLVCLLINSSTYASYRHWQTIIHQSESADIVIIGKILDITECPLTGQIAGELKERIMRLKVRVKDELKSHTYNTNILILFTCYFQLDPPPSKPIFITNDNTVTTKIILDPRAFSSHDIGLPRQSDINKEHLFFLSKVQRFKVKNKKYYTYINSYKITNGKIFAPIKSTKKWRKESINNIIKFIKTEDRTLIREKRLLKVKKIVSNIKTNMTRYKVEKLLKGINGTMDVDAQDPTYINYYINPKIMISIFYDQNNKVTGPIRIYKQNVFHNENNTNKTNKYILYGAFVGVVGLIIFIFIKIITRRRKY